MLDAASEAQILDKLESLERYGIGFVFDEQGVPGQSLQLISTPSLKQSKLGACDMDELMMSVSQTASLPVPVLSRISSHFASKACRMSIMIGKVLEVSDMKKILLHLSQIDQPWASSNLLIMMNSHH